MLVCEEEESVRFARSHAVRSRRSARGLLLMSFLYLRLNSCSGMGGHVRVYVSIMMLTFATHDAHICHSGKRVLFKCHRGAERW